MTRTERSWVFYDVGNSAFVLIMVTAIMPIFFKEYGAAGIDGAVSTSYWGFANSFSALALALLAPLLGAFGDKGRKKRLFLVFLAAGLLFTSSLTLVSEGHYLFCLFLFIFARIGWSGANIFYDSFLVDVTEKSRMDLISSRGYGWGYVGSVIPFLAVIVLLLYGGMADGLPVLHVKLGFVVVVLWWLGFSLPFIKNVHQRTGTEQSGVTAGGTFAALLGTLRSIYRDKNLFFFLCAYFFYIDGVGTIISMSTAYGHDLGFGVSLLIGVLLFIQLVAFPFTLIYGRLAQKYSARTMLFAGIGVYAVATMGAFSIAWIGDYTFRLVVFWLVAFLVASSMGGIQALSRSCYGRMIPPDRSAEYFGFYNVFGKFAAIMGPFIMGAVSYLTGDSRWGVLAILLLFVTGAFLLTKVEKQI